MLSIYDSCDSNGHVRKCISLAWYAPSHSTSDSNEFDIIPNSGATSTMRRRRSDFEDDYITCNGAFVLMDDASKIPVANYGTQIILDGNVARFINSPHVPLLDCDLYSAINHGCI